MTYMQKEALSKFQGNSQQQILCVNGHFCVENYDQGLALCIFVIIKPFLQQMPSFGRLD